MLAWYRVLCVAESTNCRGKEWIYQFLESMDEFELVVPQEIAWWLQGIGPMHLPCGGEARLTVSDLSRDDVINGKRGHFGQIGPDNYGSYASLISPYIAAAYVQVAATHGAAPNWSPGPGIAPDDVEGKHRKYTKNLLGWYDHKECQSDALDKLRRLGWGPTTLADNAHGPMNFFVSTMHYVSYALEQLGSYHRMVTMKGHPDRNGSQAHIPYLIIPHNDESEKAELSDDELERTRSSMLRVAHHSVCKLGYDIVTASFICGYRVKRCANATNTISSSFPVQLFDEKNNIVGLPVPIKDWNRTFDFGDAPEQMNPPYFRSLKRYRIDYLCNYCRYYSSR